jgi:hypothetical protein
VRLLQLLSWLSAQVAVALATVRARVPAGVERAVPALELGRDLLVWPLYLSFELYIRAWEFCEEAALQWNRQLRRWHRLALCVVLSLSGGLLWWMLAHDAPSLWRLGACLGHAAGMNLAWKRGRRWCRRQLGLRPRVYDDPKQALASIDLGN